MMKGRLACLPLAVAALLGGTAQAEPALVAHDFKLPKPLVSERFVPRPLQLRDSALDHEVIAGSVRHLDRKVYPGGKWAAAMTPERAKVEAGYYQRQFEMARGFAYMVLGSTHRRSAG